MKKRILLLSGLVLLSSATFSGVHAQTKYVAHNAAEAKAIKAKIAAIEAENANIISKNKVVEEENNILKKVQSSYQQYIKLMKKLNQELKDKAGKEITKESYNKHVQTINNDYKNDLEFFRSIDTKIRNFKTIDEINNWKKTSEYKKIEDVENKLKDIDKQIHDEIKTYFDNEEKKRAVYFWTGVICVGLLIFVTVKYSIQNYNLRRIRKFFQQLKLTDIKSSEDLKINNFQDKYASYYTTQLNEWLSDKLTRHFIEINPQSFAQNFKIIQILLATRMIFDVNYTKIWKYGENAVNVSMITAEHPEVELDRVLEKFHIKDRIKNVNYQELLQSANVINSVRVEEKLMFDQISWYKDIKGRSFMMDSAYFIFEKDCLKIVNAAVEFEVDYSKLYFSKEKHITFEDEGIKYFLNTNSKQLLMIRAFVYQNARVKLWHAL